VEVLPQQARAVPVLRVKVLQVVLLTAGQITAAVAVAVLVVWAVTLLVPPQMAGMAGSGLPHPSQALRCFTRVAVAERHSQARVELEGPALAGMGARAQLEPLEPQTVAAVVAVLAVLALDRPAALVWSYFRQRLRLSQQLDHPL